jgi:hypothetical protein
VTSESTNGADSSDPATSDGSEAPIAAASQQDEQQQDDQPVAAQTERVVAEPGVGIQGRSLDKFDGIIVRPAKEYFSFREKAVFQIQIPHAMQLFQATEGRGPMSHEEFMEKIVGANQIALPQLPPDFRYVFDPQEQELMVERPRTQ